MPRMASKMPQVPVEQTPNERCLEIAGFGCEVEQCVSVPK